MPGPSITFAPPSAKQLQPLRAVNPRAAFSFGKSLPGNQPSQSSAKPICIVIAAGGG